MNLVASARIAATELDRYFEPWLDHLLEFCDRVVLVCEDPGGEYWGGWIGTNPVYSDAVSVYHSTLLFYDHEGAARQELLDLTLIDGAASHVLAIDADEFVADGAAVRAACHDQATHWSLCMQEVWDAEKTYLGIRRDGGWDEHDATMLWAVRPYGRYRIPNRPLACGRVPEGFPASTAACTGTSVLHFGWANESERRARHARYAEHDGGRFHASTHLDSILWPRDRVRVTTRPWPVGWTNRRRQAVLDHARVTP